MNRLLAQIKSQISDAHEGIWSRHPLPTQYPCFKSAPVAARHVLSLFSGPIMVARDPSLRPLREAALINGRTLIVPDRGSSALYRIPATAMMKGVLLIDPMPTGAVVYTGDIQVLVVGCHAFDPLNTWLYGMGCTTAYLISELPELISKMPLVICMVSDAQQVSGWPRIAEAHQAAAVVTATRLIALGTGETEML